MYSVGCDIMQELSLVKNKIYSELVANRGIHIYQPEMFREFCISAGATKLFDAILDAIKSEGTLQSALILIRKGLCQLFTTFATV